MKYNKTQGNDLYYIVELNEKAEWELRNLTTITPRFCGKLVNNNGRNFYFELNGHPNSVVIIPHSWIDWMAPSKILNQPSKEYKDLSIKIDANLKRTYSKK